jgi:hypothetical protein
MTDRELLELAAKAAGIECKKTPIGFYLSDEDRNWNPLTDDGDALRLAVKLKLSISAVNPAFIEVAIFKDGEARLLFRDGTMDSGWNEDPYASTRRAITRAAAEIGKTKCE